ncbi:uncharacterized protein MONOS_18036 [Monocercomonoides exilis]|uniref:uncharacterized protein n=1 Tax=Monocercomonoides exilis TaxID=2049356 RepID=UPI00355971AC|nr:hypothetical protein MONOS_18036 [Monocercomonoides exilis]
MMKRNEMRKKELNESEAEVADEVAAKDEEGEKKSECLQIMEDVKDKAEGNENEMSGKEMEKVTCRKKEHWIS